MELLVIKLQFFVFVISPCCVLARVCMLGAISANKFFWKENAKLKICMFISLPTGWEYGEKAIDRFGLCKNANVPLKSYLVSVHVC